MKKIYSALLLSIFLCMAGYVHAQQVPNPSFEDWSGEKFDGKEQPKDWFGSNISQVGINFNLTNRGRCTGYHRVVAWLFLTG